MILLLLTIFLSFITIKKSNKLSSMQIFLIITTIILGVGSQIMMLISPVYGERNTLFAGFMIIFFTAILICNLSLTKNKVLNFLEYLFYLFLISFAIFNILEIYKGYKTTNEIQKANIQIINEFKEKNKNDSIDLYKFKDDRFGWSMPYISSYHEYWFKIYYEIPDAKITWKNYKS